MRLDHLAVTAGTLEQGVAAVEAALGVELAPGGTHAAMGTHNRLLSLGPGIYLEVIAIDPEGVPPGRPRWFDLDRRAGSPRLSNWIAACDDLAAALRRAPEGLGAPVAFERGDLAWQMAVPVDGRLPFDGAAPALIEWAGEAHPAPRLPDRGCRLHCLHVAHPEADALLAAWPALREVAGVRFATAGQVRLCAEIDTPRGRVLLE